MESTLNWCFLLSFCWDLVWRSSKDQFHYVTTSKLYMNNVYWDIVLRDNHACLRRMECKQLSTLESYGLIPKQKSNMWQFGLGMLVCARLWTCTASGREGRNLVILLECGNSLMFCEYTCTCLSETKGGVGYRSQIAFTQRTFWQQLYCFGDGRKYRHSKHEIHSTLFWVGSAEKNSGSYSLENVLLTC